MLNQRQWISTAFFIPGGVVNQELTTAFAQLELFRDLDPADLDKFLAECRSEFVPASTVVFREGDEPDRFYVVIDGTVEIWKDYGTPYADILAIRGPGSCFGEMSLIDELPRSATVKAATDVEVVTLGMAHFRQVIAQNPRVALLIMKSVSQMVRVSNDAYQLGLRQKNLQLEHAYEELKQAQDDLIRSEKLTTLGKFSSMIIHDLRNPLSIVKGYAELLASSPASVERTAQVASKLLGEADRLNRMVGELLDYSRGNIRLSLGPVDLGDMLTSLKEQFDLVLGARNIAFTTQNTVEQPVLADRERLQRVFANLIDNARKAMRHGGHLVLSAHPWEDWVVITVADDGEGMDEATRARLFEPFFSASSAGGTGLGMLVVANVVEAHRGTVAVESKPGQGTTIRITLPNRWGN